MYKLELEVKEPYYSFIKSGEKTIEGRLSREKYLDLLPGDLLKINDLEVEVIRTTQYPSFHDMLETEGYQKIVPEATDIEYATNVYYQFYKPEDEKFLGVLAIEIKLV